MRLFNIVKALATKFAPFSASTFQNVGENYNSANLIFYQGTWLTPSRFPNAAFLVVLTSKYSQNKTSIYSITTGSTDNIEGISVLQMAASSPAPQLVRTTSGGIAVIWPSGSGITDDVSVGIIGLKGVGGGYYLAPKGWWQYETIHRPISPDKPHNCRRKLVTDRADIGSIRRCLCRNASINSAEQVRSEHSNISESVFADAYGSIWLRHLRRIRIIPRHFNQNDINSELVNFAQQPGELRIHQLGSDRTSLAPERGWAV